MASGLGGYSFSPADYCCSVFFINCIDIITLSNFFFLKYIQNNAACGITSAIGTVFLNGTAQQFLCLCLYIYVCYMNTRYGAQLNGYQTQTPCLSVVADLPLAPSSADPSDIDKH